MPALSGPRLHATLALVQKVENVRKAINSYTSSADRHRRAEEHRTQARVLRTDEIPASIVAHKDRIGRRDVYQFQRTLKRGRVRLPPADISAKHRRINPIEMTTQPYPGFPTDIQAQLMAMLAIGDGMSVVTERIFPDRFLHVGELNRMGARIRKEGPTAVIHGVKELQGAHIMASDLRASAALVLAALAAKGTTRIDRVYHIDRGYEKIEEKLVAVGADIRRVKEARSVA